MPRYLLFGGAAAIGVAALLIYAWPRQSMLLPRASVTPDITRAVQEFQTAFARLTNDELFKAKAESKQPKSSDEAKGKTESSKHPPQAPQEDPEWNKLLRNSVDLAQVLRRNPAAFDISAAFRNSRLNPHDTYVPLNVRKGVAAAAEEFKRQADANREVRMQFLKDIGNAAFDSGASRLVEKPKHSPPGPDGKTRIALEYNPTGITQLRGNRVWKTDIRDIPGAVTELQKIEEFQRFVNTNFCSLVIEAFADVGCYTTEERAEVSAYLFAPNDPTAK